MRFCLALALFAIFAFFTEASNSRRKRFLSPKNWAFLSDRLRYPDHEVPRIDSPFSGLLRGSPLDAIFGPIRESSSIRRNEAPNKKAPQNVHRELEDPDEGESNANEGEVIVRPAKKQPEIQTGHNPHVDREVPIFINPFGFNPGTFTFGLFQPWWKGPNVCVERSEVDESTSDDASGGFMINFESTQCSPSETAYTCTKKIRRSGLRKTIIIKHQCCHGYARKEEGQPGCTQVSMEDTMETVRSLEASRFADMLSLTEVKDKMTFENFTIFAPTNDAMIDFEDESDNNEILNVRPQKDFSELVGGHIVEGLVNLGTVQDDEALQSINGKTTIRINKYSLPSQMVTTANCIPVTSKNNMAKNGIVHVVANMLPLPKKSVADILQDNPNASLFSKLLRGSSDIIEEMEDAKKSWTVFAPTDKAFQNMDPEVLQKLLTGEGCVESIIRHHLVKGTYCSQGMVGQSRVRNSLGKVMTITQNEIERYKIDDVKISSTDDLGTNGVVHYIDEVIFPSEAQGLLESLASKQRQDLVDLIKLANLEATFENLHNVTFFAPSKDAIKAVSNETWEEWNNNPEKLKEILLYHLVSPKTSISGFRHNQELASLAEDHSIRMQIHEMFPGIPLGASAQCSLLVNHDNEVCGAVVHSLDKIITPPKGSIMEALKSMKGHDTILKLLESTDLENKLSKESEGPYTLLAPNDEAFERFDKDSMKELFDNKTMAEQILRMHVLPETLCCSSVSPVFPFRHHYVRTLEGNLLSLHRNSLSDRVRFGPARAVRCDTIARNGIVHSVNRVILPSRRPAIPSIFDMDIFGGLFK